MQRKKKLSSPHLPDETLLHIFSFLKKPRDLLTASQVNKQYREVASDMTLWKKLTNHDKLTFVDNFPYFHKIKKLLDRSYFFISLIGNHNAASVIINMMDPHDKSYEDYQPFQVADRYLITLFDYANQSLDCLPYLIDIIIICTSSQQQWKEYLQLLNEKYIKKKSPLPILFALNMKKEDIQSDYPIHLIKTEPMDDRFTFFARVAQTMENIVPKILLEEKEELKSSRCVLF